jgi:cell division septal protein FtsQ
LVAVVAGIGFFGYEQLGRSDLFQITAIDIQGWERIGKKEILELSGVDVHSNLLKISGAEVRALLERHNWIERAVITKNWPDRLIISVKERSPVAMVNLGNGLHYIDRHATIFAPVQPRDDLDFPVISGWRAAEPPGRENDAAALRDALQFLKHAERDNPNLPAQNISEISIRDNGLVLFLMDRPFPIRLGRGDMPAKRNRLVKVLYWLYKRKEFDRVCRVDVDYARDKVLIAMGPL